MSEQHIRPARRPDRLPRRLAVAVACGRIGDRPPRRIRAARRARRMGRTTNCGLRRAGRRDHRVAVATGVVRSGRAVPAGRRPHRFPVPEGEATARRGNPRVEAARRRGLRRHSEQLVARPRPRCRRTVDRRRRHRDLVERGRTDRSRPPTRGPPRPRRQRRRPAPRHPATPEPRLGCRFPERRRFRVVDRGSCRARRAARPGGNCRCTTSREPRCSAPTVHSSRPAGSTTSSPAGPRSPHWRPRPHRPRGDDRVERPRGGRLVEPHGRRRAVPRPRDRPTGRVARRNRPATGSEPSPARSACRPTTPTPCTRTIRNVTSRATARS